MHDCGILLESAWFAPNAVRRTSKRLGLRSESSYRFERGADIGICDWASRRAAQLILETAGGELASGVVDPAWPTDGRALCTAANSQYAATIVVDQEGGAIVAWQDFRNSTTGYDIYAQHVLASGAVDPAWPADGRALCTAANSQYSPAIIVDGAGGAIVTWYDYRGGITYDIYAQHVLASGAVDPVWPVDGRALCTAANSQDYATIVSDGAGGAIVAWEDGRTSGTTGIDIYARRVYASGEVSGVPPATATARLRYSVLRKLLPEITTTSPRLSAANRSRKSAVV